MERLFTIYLILTKYKYIYDTKKQTKNTHSFIIKKIINKITKFTNHEMFNFDLKTYLSSMHHSSNEMSFNKQK